MTVSRSFEYTADNTTGQATVQPWQEGKILCAADDARAAARITSLLEHSLEHNSFAVEPDCSNAAAIYCRQDEFFMLASPAGQCIVVYEDGLIDRAVDGSDKEVIHNVPSATVTVPKAVVMAVPCGNDLSDSDIRQLIYALASGEVARLEYQVSRNTAQKERLDARKRSIQNQLLELDRQRDELEEKREELYRQLEQLSGGYSRLVSEEKKAETQLRETIQNLVREQMAANHDLRKS